MIYSTVILAMAIAAPRGTEGANFIRLRGSTTEAEDGRGAKPLRSGGLRGLRDLKMEGMSMAQTAPAFSNDLVPLVEAGLSMPALLVEDETTSTGGKEGKARKLKNDNKRRHLTTQEGSMPLEELDFSMAAEESVNGDGSKARKLPQVTKYQRRATEELSMPLEELEISMPARHLAESMPLEELEFSLPLEELEFSVPARRHLEESMPLEELEFSLPLEELEISMPTRHLEESMPLEELEFSVPLPLVELEFSTPVVRRLEGSMPLEELQFSLP